MAGRITELEAIRGWAAFLVLVHHSLLAFAPRLHGLVDRDPASLFGTPAFAFINGSAAVVVFFVLSGYVLTHAFLRGPTSGRVKLALSRWPRLAFPVLLVNVTVGILIMSGCMANLAAADQAASTWLGWFYNWPSAGVAEISSAFREGVYGTFLFGASKYNSSLWTMKYEFYGSFIVFGMAAACLALPRAKWVLLSCSFVVAVLVHPYYGCFIVGACMAHVRQTRMVVRFVPAIIAGALLVYLSGYHEALDGSARPAGWYEWLAPAAMAVGPEALRIALHTFVAASLIWFALNTSLGMKLDGRVGRLLGTLSFPIYLIHVPVISSIGSWAYLTVGAVSAVLVSMLVSIALAVPLSTLDRGWRQMMAAPFARVVSSSART